MNELLMNEIKNALKSFNAYINSNFEIILIEDTNRYIDLSNTKTALEFKSDTLYLSHNESLKTLNNFSNGSTNYCFLGGGVPVKSLCGKIIGGLGISGGTVEQDCMVAEKTIKLFENSL